MALMDFLKRDKVKDPFGGDDLYDGESRFAGKGPKIALAASVVMFLLLAGGVAAIVLTGKSTPPPVLGTLADLEVAEDAPAAPGATPAPTQAAAAPAPAAAGQKPAPVPDVTAATDRSVERRPWLAAAPVPADSKRMGVADATPPAKPAAPAPAAKPAEPPPVAKAAVMTPPPAPAPLAPPKPGTPAKAAPPTPEPGKPPVAAATKPMVAEAPKETPDASKETEIASADAFGPAPGAPGHFNLPAGAETGPAVAGGRPRLVEPTAPPTDKTAIAAPPPRFANLIDIKKDAKAPAAGAAKVAVVVADLGLNQAATDTAITKLPPAVTLAFSPYARDLKKWMDKAKAGGHEVLIEVPMESKGFPAEDPGPMGLLTGLDQKQNGERLDNILKESGPAIGILDTEGSKFREFDTHIAAVFAKLKEHNLFYVQGEPGVRVGEATVPVAVADVVLDERPFRADVDARLDYAERLAKYQGSAVASLGAKPVGFERLVLWIDQAQKKGVALAPISQVLTR